MMLPFLRSIIFNHEVIVGHSSLVKGVDYVNKDYLHILGFGYLYLDFLASLHCSKCRSRIFLGKLLAGDLPTLSN